MNLPPNEKKKKKYRLESKRGEEKRSPNWIHKNWTCWKVKEELTEFLAKLIASINNNLLIDLILLMVC